MKVSNPLSFFSGKFVTVEGERSELKEGGHFEAKLIVLLNLRRENKGLPCIEEEETMHTYDSELSGNWCYSNLRWSINADIEG